MYIDIEIQKKKAKGCHLFSHLVHEKKKTFIYLELKIS